MNPPTPAFSPAHQFASLAISAVMRSFSSEQEVAKSTTGQLDCSLRYTSSMRVLGIDCGTEYTGYGVVELCQDDTPGLPQLRRHQAFAARSLCPSAWRTIFHRLGARHPGTPPRSSRHRRCFLRPQREIRAETRTSARSRHAGGLLRRTRGCGILATLDQIVRWSDMAGQRSIKSSKWSCACCISVRIPEPADAADALAIAICHLHTSATLQRQRAAAR